MLTINSESDIINNVRTQKATKVALCKDTKVTTKINESPT